VNRVKREPSALLEAIQHFFVIVHMTVHSNIPLRRVSSALKIVSERRKTNVRFMPLVSYEILTAGLKKLQFFGMQSGKCIYQPIRVQRDLAEDLNHHHLRKGKEKSEAK
jgi:hypothetical protein